MLEYLIFGPVKKILNLGDQALLLGCLSKIPHNHRITILVSRDTDISFLKYTQRNIKLLFLPKIKPISINLIKDFIAVVFFFIYHLFFKFQGLYFLAADVVDGRYGRLAYSYLFLLYFNKLISKKCYISSFSFLTFTNGLNSFVLKKLKDTAIFEPRDSKSLELFKKECSPKEIFLVKDFSFLAPHVSFDEAIHDWIDEQKELGHRILLFCPANRPNIKNIDDFLQKVIGQLNSWKSWSFVVVCHVFDDQTISICRKAEKLFKNHKFLLIHPDVSLVRDITSKVDLVFSCLMHCGLGGVRHRRTTILLDYHEKMKNLAAGLNCKNLFVLDDENDFFDTLLSFKDANNI